MRFCDFIRRIKRFIWIYSVLLLISGSCFGTSVYDSLAHKKALDLFARGSITRSKADIMELLKSTSPGLNQLLLISDLGNIYLHQQEYSIARDLFSSALAQVDTIKGIDSEIGYVNLLFRNATAEARLQNNLAAIIGFDQVRTRYNDFYGQNHPKTIGIILEIADLYLKIGNASKASGFYDEAEFLIPHNGEQPENEINALIGRAKYSYATQSYNISLDLLSQALVKIDSLEGRNSPEYVSTLPFVSSCLVQIGSLDSAKTLLEYSLEELKTINGSHHLTFLETKLAYAEVLWIEKMYNLAFEKYTEIFVEYVNQYERFFYSLSVQDRAIRYNRIGEVHEKMSTLMEFIVDNESLLQFLQLTILFNDLPMQPHNKSVLMDNPLFEKWNNLLEELWELYKSPVSTLPNGLQDIVKRQKNIEKQAQTMIKKGVMTRNELSLKRSHISTIRDVLEPNQGGVEILRYRQYTPNNESGFTDSIRYAYLVFSGNTEEPILYKVNKNGHSLENKYLSYYRSSIKHRFIDDYAYYNYWTPLKELVQQFDQLLITPDGAYLQINLNTLRNPESHQYLNDEISIRLLTSSSNILETNDPNPNTERKVFIFGNPDYDQIIEEETVSDSYLRYVSNSSLSGMHYLQGKISEHHQWSELLYKDELKAQETLLLESLYSSSGFQIQLYTSDSASEANIKLLKNPFAVHLSLHGYFMENQDFNPSIYQENRLLKSGMLLSGSNDFLNVTSEPLSLNDGILTTWEIYNLDFQNTELLYLSSCETGLGIVANDISIKSFERAFQYAGVRTIIMSLWTTESEYEIEFMNLFYYYWLFEDKSKREAFTQAQKNMKQSYERPYYWGAFILLGE